MLRQFTTKEVGLHGAVVASYRRSMNQEQLMEQAEFLRDQQREDEPERTPEKLLEILNKARAEMKEIGL